MGKTFNLITCFFGIFMLLSVGVFAQSHVSTNQDENSTPENYEDYNQSASIVQPFQIGWTAVMLASIILAALGVTLVLIRRGR